MNGSCSITVCNNNLDNQIPPSNSIDNIDLLFSQSQYCTLSELHNHSSEPYDYDFDIDALDQVDVPINVSTPPLSLSGYSITEIPSNPYLINSSTRINGQENVYETYFSPESTATLIWQENQVSSSVSTPPEQQTTSVATDMNISSAHNQVR